MYTYSLNKKSTIANGKGARVLNGLAIDRNDLNRRILVIEVGINSRIFFPVRVVIVVEKLMGNRNITIDKSSCGDGVDIVLGNWGIIDLKAELGTSGSTLIVRHAVGKHVWGWTAQSIGSVLNITVEVKNLEITTNTRNDAAQLKGVGTAVQADEGQCDLGTVLVWTVSIVVVALYSK